jgi:hypothetical protein
MKEREVEMLEKDNDGEDIRARVQRAAREKNIDAWGTWDYEREHTRGGNVSVTEAP